MRKTTNLAARAGSRALAWWVGGTTLVVAAALGLLVVAVLIVIAGKASLEAQQASGCSTDVATAAVTMPGAQGGMYGTGITRAEYNTVKRHPAARGIFTAGRYRATQYGPPWGVQNGVDQGAGIATAGGIRINGGAPRKYMVAVDTSVISLGEWVYVWPNQFGWRGPFLAADTGGAVRGQHIDVYDWRGTFTTMNGVQVSRRPIAEAETTVPVADVAPVPAPAGESTSAGLGDAVAAAAAADAGFAVVDASGRVLASHEGARPNRSASVTKAMILAALTRLAAGRDLTASERSDAARMIRDSDNAAANRLYARVGASRVRSVGQAAGMRRFRLVERKQTAAGFILGYSQVTAADLARLFATLDEVLAERHRTFALAELEQVQGAGRFGFLDADLPGTIRSKGGWRPEDDGGWTVNQAAQLTVGGQRVGVAVTLRGEASFAAGAAVTRRIAAALQQDVTIGQLGADCAPGTTEPAGPVAQRIGQLARKYLGMNARTEPFEDFQPSTFSLAWCAHFATNVWRLAGVEIPWSAFSAAPYTWAAARGQLFKAVGQRPKGATPPLGAALMYGSGPQNVGTSQHVNLVDTVLPDGTVMITGGNQGNSSVTRYGPCRMSRSDPAFLSGPGCDSRPIYGIAAPTGIGAGL